MKILKKIWLVTFCGYGAYKKPEVPHEKLNESFEPISEYIAKGKADEAVLARAAAIQRVSDVITKQVERDHMERVQDQEMRAMIPKLRGMSDAEFAKVVAQGREVKPPCRDAWNVKMVWHNAVSEELALRALLKKGK